MKISKHLHTKHGKNTHTKVSTHACTHKQTHTHTYLLLVDLFYYVVLVSCVWKNVGTHLLIFICLEAVKIRTSLS